MYKIYAISQGQLEVDYGRIMPWVVDGGTKGLIDFYCWVIKGEDSTILVDTGMTDEEANIMCATKKLGGIKYLQERFKKIGVDPKAIKTVIISHLHADHFSAFDLYPNALFYIQKREIEFFTGPAIKYLQVYQFAANISDVVRLAYAKRVRFLDGDEQIAPGVKAVLIGGHTPGSQAVVVSTRKGDAVVCGDAVDLYRTMDVNVSGMAVDLIPALVGLDRIRALASSPDLIIPAHDPLVLSRFPGPMEGMAEIV